ncbi:MAG: hypothetical protein IPH18_12445 [Chitinophagaceae bacterium]|nr:hypothetical protein [Chitinophagaceae bacterium]
MSKEPRVSAVALLHSNMGNLMTIKDQFSVAEREFYLKLLQQEQILHPAWAACLMALQRY